MLLLVVKNVIPWDTRTGKDIIWGTFSGRELVLGGPFLHEALHDFPFFFPSSRESWSPSSPDMQLSILFIIMTPHTEHSVYIRHWHDSFPCLILFNPHDNPMKEEHEGYQSETTDQVTQMKNGRAKIQTHVHWLQGSLTTALCCLPYIPPWPLAQVMGFLHLFVIPSRLSALQSQELWLFCLCIPSTWHRAWLRMNK